MRETDKLAVPDLVFNEMRFLQRPAEHQDQPIKAQDQQQVNKKDKKRGQDEEISVFFQRSENNGSGASARRFDETTKEG